MGRQCRIQMQYLGTKKTEMCKSLRHLWADVSLPMALTSVLCSRSGHGCVPELKYNDGHEEQSPKSRRGVEEATDATAVRSVPEQRYGTSVHGRILPIQR